ncbi:MAG TPA: dihydropteroate synthase, partial [Thermoleophilaceae bacterium]|nr:dihydropteroate synthase [Thermoleophilaceae bacterium]
EAVSLRGRVLSVDRPVLMGIVNATPDSFSDEQRPKELGELMELADRLTAQGAELIDVGGESGRSDRPAVPVAEEIARVVPLVERLAGAGITVSVDTWRAPVARAALDAGAAMINDVSGLTEPEIADACAASGAGLVVTHTRTPPKSKAYPAYDDVVDDVIALLAERSAEARRRGVADDQLVLDPGVDLAKTPADSVTVLRRLDEVRALGRPLLLALSRKDFIGAITERAPSERLGGTLAAVGAVVEGGESILRVHDVAAARDYLAVRAALRGEREVSQETRLAEALRREPA